MFRFKSDIFKIDNINFSAKSNFSFKINKNYRITNLKIFSDMKIDKMSIIQNNKKELQKTFPKIKTNIDFFDHTTKVEYSKKNCQ